MPITKSFGTDFKCIVKGCLLQIFCHIRGILAESSAPRVFLEDWATHSGKKIVLPQETEVCSPTVFLSCWNIVHLL
jgi:hypothetical protein